MFPLMRPPIFPVCTRRQAQFLYKFRASTRISTRTCSIDASPSLDLKHQLRSAHETPIPPADHRSIATRQDLFVTSQYSPGSPLFLPNGSHVFNKLLAFLRAQYGLFGFQEVITPTIYKKSLWEISGHWDNYHDDMFEVKGRGASGQSLEDQIGQDEDYGLKPMNCPGHCLLFSSRRRTYRELPIRFADFGALHRNEISGALSGLTRVRRFHQDDGHIFCRPSQIADEITASLQFVAMVYKTFQLPPFRLALSTRPESSFIGTVAEWDRAEDALKKALDNSGQNWTLKEGDGAFYGPKIDVVLRDSDGKEHQAATIQLDFQLPRRFGLQYDAPMPEREILGQPLDESESQEAAGPVTPVIIHRAVMGSIERFMALLMEHYNGRWPFWLSPRQCIVLTVSNKVPGLRAYVDEVAEAVSGAQRSGQKVTAPVKPQRMDSQMFAVDIDDSDRSLSKKISEAKRKGYGMILVAGKRSLEKGTVELDMTALTSFDTARQLLCELAGVDAVGSGRCVQLTPEMMRRYSCVLSEHYL